MRSQQGFEPSCGEESVRQAVPRSQLPIRSSSPSLASSSPLLLTPGFSRYHHSSTPCSPPPAPSTSPAPRPALSPSLPPAGAPAASSRPRPAASQPSLTLSLCTARSSEGMPSGHGNDSMKKREKAAEDQYVRDAVRGLSSSPPSSSREMALACRRTSTDCSCPPPPPFLALSPAAPTPAARSTRSRRRPLLLPTSPSLSSPSPLARAPCTPSSGAREAQGAAEVDRGVQGAPRRAREEPRRARGEHRQEELRAVGVARGHLSSCPSVRLGGRDVCVGRRRGWTSGRRRRCSSEEEDEGGLNNGYHCGNSSSDFGSSLRCAAMLACERKGATGEAEEEQLHRLVVLAALVVAPTQPSRRPLLPPLALHLVVP